MWCAFSVLVRVKMGADTAVRISTESPFLSALAHFHSCRETGRCIDPLKTNIVPNPEGRGRGFCDATMEPRHATFKIRSVQTSVAFDYGPAVDAMAHYREELERLLRECGNRTPLHREAPAVIADIDGLSKLLPDGGDQVVPNRRLHSIP